jgi:O-antigen ligase
VARKRKAPASAADAERPAQPAAGVLPSPTPAAATAGDALPAEVTRGDWTVAIFSAMLFLAPAVGVPHEEMLQDTLKSIVVALGTLAAALLFFLHQRGRREPLRWHGLVWLPLALCVYALGSMAWSHAYLGGVEAIRWFVFSLIVWLGLNTLTRERLVPLAWGIHAGALAASVWAALQFWAGFDLFPQGPNPASTFINRNFFAEFVVCTLPFAWMLMARARQSGVAVALALSSGFIVTTILMTGTRAALIALWLQLLVVLPLIGWRCRDRLAWRQWPAQLKFMVPAVFAITVLGLGAIPTGNEKVAGEGRGLTAIERGIDRTQSISPKDHSLNVRMVMWRATMNAIAARPLAGLGAGAWESEIPLYQAEGSQLETDYYVHNEFLQLLAEYGVVGWAFLVLLLGYLLAAAWRAFTGTSDAEQEERPWRAVLLCSLLAFLVVSNIGFPWRMATTGAMFALCLAALAASDARLGYRGRVLAQPLRWTPAIAQAAVACTLACLALALFIAQRAAESEAKIVRAAKIALTISASGEPNAPHWAQARAEMLQLVRDGIAINPHYRKITPMVADELARWGDWANATWIWDSVLGSRPYVVAIISNAARGYSTLGQSDKALEYLERAKRIQPRAPSVRSLEVILLGRAGQEPRAKQLALDAVARGVYDYDLVNALFILSWRSKDFATAEKAMNLRMRAFPETRARGHVQLGDMYLKDLKDEARARDHFRQGIALASGREREALLAMVPPPYRDELAGQTSATKR